MMGDPVTIGLRLEAVHGGHVTVGVFVGTNPGARGKGGTITLRIAEWREIVARTPAGWGLPGDPVDIDIIPGLRDLTDADV